MTNIAIIIPALDEADNIGRVIADIPALFAQMIVVANNGSIDNTAQAAQNAGATAVVHEARRGYGYACLCAIDYLKQLPTVQQPRIVVFLDADYSDFPEEMPDLLQPILQQGFDLVVGSRTRGNCAKGALTLPQRWGNALSVWLIYRLFGVVFSDLGPFRAVTWAALMRLDMCDTTFGWTVEMQAKAAKYGLRCTEVPVSYRHRYVGQSKISRNLRGIVAAGTKILWTIGKIAFLAKKPATR